MFTEHGSAALKLLRQILNENSDKRICVVGVSCVGKTTLLNYLPEAIDMDDLLFGNKQKDIKPLLSQEEIDYVNSAWTPEIGKFMTTKAHELIKIEKGQPVFGTIVFPADLIIEIKVPDDILRDRIRKRNGNEINVFNMKAQIESEIALSGVEKVVIQNI